MGKKPILVALSAAVFTFAAACNVAEGSSGDTASLAALPVSVLDFENRVDALSKFGQSDSTVVAREQAAEKLSSAHDGAAVTSQAYTDEELSRSFTLFSIAATAPGLWSAQDSEASAEQLRLALPPERVVAEAGAQCLVRPAANHSDSTGPTRPAETVIECQARGNGATVLATGFAGEIDADLGMQVVQQALDHVTG